MITEEERAKGAKGGDDKFEWGVHQVFLEQYGKRNQVKELKGKHNHPVPLESGTICPSI